MSSAIERLNHQSYLAMIHNSIGTTMYRNFYISVDGGPATDAINDGENACAFYVSSLLLVFGKQTHVHATVTSTVKDLRKLGWVSVAEEGISPGDVIVWSGRDDNSDNEHIGFYVGGNEAISTSTSQRKVVKHNIYFGDLKREIKTVYHMAKWESTPEDKN